MLKTSRGSSLLEVLVAMLLLSLGILSMGAMHARAAQATRTGQHVAIASQLAADLGERTRANVSAARLGAYDVDAGSGLVMAKQSGLLSTVCSAAACTSTELAARDVAQWTASALDQLPGTGLVAHLDGGDTPAMNIWIVWREARTVTSVPSDKAGGMPAASRRCPPGVDTDVAEAPYCVYVKVPL